MTPSTNVQFTTLAVLKGKGLTQADKVSQHVKNGAHTGALVAVGVGRKAIVEAMGADGIKRTIAALAGGNIRPAAALIVARHGKALAIMEEDGKAPYSEWLRLGATLRGMAHTTDAGKPTSAGKAMSLWTMLTDGAQALRDEREAQRQADRAKLGTDGPTDDQGAPTDGASDQGQDGAPTSDQGAQEPTAADA